MSEQAQPVGGSASVPLESKTPLYKRRWFAPVVAGIVGIGIGAAGAGGSDATPETAAEPAPTVTVEVEQDPPPAPPAETITVDPAPDVQAALDARSAELDQRSADLDAREAEISGQEAAIEAGTIPGDGVYIVGTDVQPGTYRSTPADGGIGTCYWARLAGTDDIIDNNLGEGQMIAEIAPGDSLFETRGCNDWTIVP